MERKGKEILVLSVRPSLSISPHLFWGPGSFSFNTESKQTSQRGKIMAVNIPFFSHSPLSVPSFLRSLPLTAFPSSSFYSPVSRIRISCCCSSSSSPLMDPLPKFKELPFVPASQRDLMLDLVSTLEARLGSSLLPCSLPPDVQYYRNQNGTAEGSLYIRSGVPSSPVLSFSLSLSFILPLPVTNFLNYLLCSFCPFSCNTLLLPLKKIYSLQEYVLGLIISYN